MKTIFYKNELGYAVVYPTKRIYAYGSRVPNNVLVAGRGPTIKGAPSSTTDQIFRHVDLGTEISEDRVPLKWREPLGVLRTDTVACEIVKSPTQQTKAAFTTVGLGSTQSDDQDLINKTAVWMLIGGGVGLVLGILQNLGLLFHTYPM
jgi:hypothetical protein